MSIATVLEASVRAEYSARLVHPPTRGEHIQVLGLTASGKTTAIKAFVNRFPYWKHVYDSAFLETARLRTYHEQLLIQGDPYFYLAFQIEALLIRFLQNAHVARGSICDQSAHSIWAYSKVLVQRGYLSRSFYETFFAAYLTFRSVAPSPATVVLFTCDPSIARARVVARGRSHEQEAYTPQFLTQLGQAYSAVVDDFPQDVPLHTIDTTEMTPDEATAALETILNAQKN
ncbi:MAG: hypothetical protein QOC72_1384 [Methylobacteriaceae bacterium]|nr:hypothetical protein [Methylobacteriaceae bacterium]